MLHCLAHCSEGAKLNTGSYDFSAYDVLHSGQAYPESNSDSNLKITLTITLTIYKIKAKYNLRKGRP
jgi:hypothetical protein